MVSKSSRSKKELDKQIKAAMATIIEDLKAGAEEIERNIKLNKKINELKPVKEKKKKKSITVENFNLDKFLIALLRNSFKSTPMFTEAKNKAKEEYFVESKNGKQLRRVRWKCAICERYFYKEDAIDKDGNVKLDSKGKPKQKVYMAVDHVNPAVEIESGFTNILDFINGLFCRDINTGKISLDNLQYICQYKEGQFPGIACHVQKSQAEAKLRPKKKKSKK